MAYSEAPQLHQPGYWYIAWWCIGLYVLGGVIIGGALAGFIAAGSIAAGAGWSFQPASPPSPPTGGYDVSGVAICNKNTARVLHAWQWPTYPLPLDDPLPVAPLELKRWIGRNSMIYDKTYDVDVRAEIIMATPVSVSGQTITWDRDIGVDGECHFTLDSIESGISQVSANCNGELDDSAGEKACHCAIRGKAPWKDKKCDPSSPTSPACKNDQNCVPFTPDTQYAMDYPCPGTPNNKKDTCMAYMPVNKCWLTPATAKTVTLNCEDEPIRPSAPYCKTWGGTSRPNKAGARHLCSWANGFQCQDDVC